MAYGTVEETRWPVDTDEVEWRLRHTPQHITESDHKFAASVMGAYAHLVDPMVGEDDAIAALKRARLVSVAVREGLAETQKMESEALWVAVNSLGVHGPFTWGEASEFASRRGGTVKRLNDAH